jgi:hypothetical protein
MGIPNKQNARYNSFQEFLSQTKGRDNSISFNNLFSVRFSTPPMMRQGSGSVASPRMQVETSDLNWLLDFYADTVNLPSKQITTAQTPYVGAPFKYATNTAYSQISINFRMPRSQYSRNFFERWTTMMASDSEQYTRYYQDYTCPKMYIYKWERGGGDIAVSDPKMIRAIRANGGASLLLARKYQLTAAWELQNLYPYNIGSVQLNNAQAQSMTLNVGFYYERYRFFTAGKFDDPGLLKSVTVPARRDNNTDQETSRNSSDFTNRLFSGFPLSSGSFA